MEGRNLLPSFHPLLVYMALPHPLSLFSSVGLAKGSISAPNVRSRLAALGRVAPARVCTMQCSQVVEVVTRVWRSGEINFWYPGYRPRLAALGRVARLRVFRAVLPDSELRHQIFKIW